MEERARRLVEAGLESDASELQRLVGEQTALRRVATLVAAGASDADLVNAVTSEVAHLLGAQRANTLRWDGDTIRVIGEWSTEGTGEDLTGRVFPFGGDTITARVVKAAEPARVESLDDLQTEFARARWEELGIHASIGAPIIVDGRVWGVITASRTTANDPFPPGDEHKLGDFAALVAQAIANSEARREVALLVEEQTALRRVATLVAGGRPEPEVLEAATREAAQIFGAEAVYVVRWEGVQDEVVVRGGWDEGPEPLLPPRALYHPEPGSPTIRLLETGFASRGEEPSLELERRSVIAAPVITGANLLGGLVAFRASDNPFPSGGEIRLRSFADLVAQSIANAQAESELRASRVRIVRAADEARRKLERNLHDGAQQRLVSVALSLRVAMANLPRDPGKARDVLAGASAELATALDELRDLARGIHPTTLTEQGLGPALELLAQRTPFDVAVANELGERLPGHVEAAAYYVVLESLTNVAKYAHASKVEVRVSRSDGLARVEVEDDGVGGADMWAGSGLRGLADRVEALDGRFGVESPKHAGTRVWAEIPVS
jgi:signal transduction histidine kinase